MKEKERIKKIFGQLLYEQRMACNLKQAELAEKSRMDETYISDLERGNYMPSLYTVIKLTWGLDIPIEQFLSTLNTRLHKQLNKNR
jgi:transcriptional regulator with XRE-family HTH domain